MHQFIQRSAFDVVDDNKVDAVFKRLKGVSDCLLSIHFLHLPSCGWVYLATNRAVGDLRLGKHALELSAPLAALKLFDFAAYDMRNHVPKAKIVSTATILRRWDRKIIQ